MRAPDFWQHDGLWARMLAPASCVYRLTDRALRSSIIPYASTVPVLCVGNLTVGGQGKTPVALALAATLKQLGQSPWFLSRGYGGSEAGPLIVSPGEHGADQVGDEPLLLARTAPVVIARDRAAGARLAEEGGASLIVMDDGFQNPGLMKDASLIVVDGTVGFGNHRVLPAGPLRETVEHGLARANGIVIIGADQQEIEAEIAGRLPIFRAKLDLADPTLRDRRVIAFAGIGRPQKFFDSLASAGAVVVERFGFSDHHRFTSAELERLSANAQRTGASLVTTAKDAVRLPTDFRDQVEVLEVSFRWLTADPVPQLLAGPLSR